MMDALEHRINVEGHLMAHGGFDMQNDLGVATVGQAREPINAWLPMYVCETHWQRVKVSQYQMGRIHSYAPSTC